jgi:hypothetical protein
MGSRVLAAGSAALVVAVLAACGSQSSSATELTLDEWRDRICAAGQQLNDVPLASEPKGEEPFESFESMRREVDAIMKVVAALKAVPPPSEQRAEAQEFVALMAAMAERYEESAPRIEAASRRLREAMESIDASDLPPAPEDATVAGGIMAQMMSIPEFNEAWADLMRESEAVMTAVNVQELERLSNELGIAACLDGNQESPPSAVEPEPCRSIPGNPITENALKQALAARGIQLHRDDRCYGDDVASLSNLADPVPYEQNGTITADEGHIFCDVHPRNLGSQLERFVWRNDPNPVYVRVLNVSCSIYPEARKHVDTLEQALRDLPGVSAAPAAVPNSTAMRD